jgi:transcriptional regulator with XRE-family HTH domain
MDLRQLFATNLRRIRHQRKLCQERLAHDAEVDRAYVSGVERAATYVGLEIIGKLSVILETDRPNCFGGQTDRDQGGSRTNDWVLGFGPRTYTG